MEEICNRIHRAILDEPDMTQLSITTQEIKDLSLKTMRDSQLVERRESFCTE
jgi:hypothetical protein